MRLAIDKVRLLLVYSAYQPHVVLAWADRNEAVANWPRLYR